MWFKPHRISKGKGKGKAKNPGNTYEPNGHCGKLKGKKGSQKGKSERGKDQTGKDEYKGRGKQKGYALEDGGSSSAVAPPSEPQQVYEQPDHWEQ